MKYALYFTTILFIVAASTVEHRVIRFAPDDVTFVDMSVADIELNGERIPVGREVVNELFWNDEVEQPFHEVIIVQSTVFGYWAYARSVTYVYAQD